MVEFEFYLNSVEDSDKVFQCKESPTAINEAVYLFLTQWEYNDFISFSTAIDCACWAEFACDGDEYETNEFWIRKRYLNYKE